MTPLPLANILHHKLRSSLSVAGIAISVCMLITLSGLARGSLSEVADRWESVDADLIAYSDALGRDIVTLAGVSLSDRYADHLTAKRAEIVRSAVPVFLWQMQLAGQSNVVAGVDPQHLASLTGGTPFIQGRSFDPRGEFTKWLTESLAAAPDGGELFTLDLPESPAAALEIVIDSRLAEAGGYRLGDVITSAGHDWQIVGIVQVGGLARAYIPRRAAQFLFGGADITKSTLIFVKLNGQAGVESSARELAMPGLRLVPTSQYRMMLRQRFAVMYNYIDVVNAITMLVTFLFISIVLYTTVLQQRREIAILRSCGASHVFLLAQVLSEAAILAGGGLVLGTAGSFLAADAIERARPLLTVAIQPQWILIATCAAAAGAVVSSVFPAWFAIKIDMVEALALE